MRKYSLNLGIIILLLIFSSCNNSGSNGSVDKENEKTESSYDETAKKALNNYMGELKEIVDYYNKEYSLNSDEILSDSTLSDKSRLESKEKELRKLFNINENAAREYRNRLDGEYLRSFLLSGGVSKTSTDQIVNGFNKALQDNRNYTLEIFEVQKSKISTLFVLTKVFLNNFGSYRLEDNKIIFSDKQTEKRVNELKNDYQMLSEKEKELIDSSQKAAPFDGIQ